MADAQFTNVVLLLHADTTVGADSGPGARTPSSTGDCVLSTVRSKFSSPASTLSPKSAPMQWASNAAFNISGIDWCIEFWYYEVSGQSSLGGLISRRAASSADGWAIQKDGLRAEINGAWSDTQMTWTAPSQDAWHHFALACVSGTIRAIIDGVVVATKASVTTIADVAVNVCLAQSDNGSENRSYIHFEELRYTVGNGRYTDGTGLPPAAAFAGGPLISGTVRDSGGTALSGRTVRAYRRDTGALLLSTTTASGASISFADEVAADAPVIQFRMTEVGGTTAANSGSVGAAADGTYTGGYTLDQAGFVAGGKSVLFGGSASAGRIVSASSTAYTSAVTLECWFNAEAAGQATGDIATLVGKIENNAATTADFPIQLAWKPSTTKVQFRLDRGNDFSQDLIMESGTLAHSTTYHVVGVYRANGTCELYVNGALVALSVIAFTISTCTTKPWVVGGATPNVAAASVTAFHGRIGEVAIYNSALTAVRIAKHYSAPNAGAAIGTYSVDQGTYSGECNVIALDDAGGTVENDVIIRVTGA